MLGAPDRVGRGDRWHIGSSAKAMTAPLYARLVEAGAARWDMAIPSLFRGLTLDPTWSAITIDDLLSHTGGVADRAVMRLEFMAAARADSRPLSIQRTELARLILEKPPAGTPGEMVYSNVGYAIAGAAIERLTNLAWEDAMHAFVFKPLGMASAGFGAPTGEYPRGHRRVPPQFVTLTPADVGVMGITQRSRGRPVAPTCRSLTIAGSSPSSSETLPTSLTRRRSPV